MQKYNIAILTESRYENPTKSTPYIENILLEDRLLQEALERKNLSVIRIDWDKKDFDWTSVDFAIFRSTWDYMIRFDEFKTWFDATHSKTKFINPPAIIEWNMDKHYFQDLAKKGINIPSTIYAHKGDDITLMELFQQGGHEEAVIKPTVSAGGKHTYRINANNIQEYEAVFQEVIAEEDMMIQPFLTSVMKRGEVSLMVMNGQYTHSVLKIAKKGDFRVQDNWGGTVHHYEPTVEEMAFSEQVVAACEPPPIYARVDIANDNEGKVTLIEAELFEPELWFRFNEKSADVLADGVIRYMKEVEKMIATA